MKAYSIQKELNDKRGMANGLSSIGKIFKLQGNNHKALEFFKRSLELREEVKDQSGIALSLNQLSSILIEENKYAEALEASQRALNISLKLGHIENIKTSALRLSQIYKHNGNGKVALENFELYIKMRDSSNNELTKKASLKAQLKYEYEKQAAADSVAHAKESEIKNVELAKQRAEIKAKKNQQYALFGGLFCVCVFGVFMFNRFKVTQKQKSIIEDQKSLVELQKQMVEEKQKEILASIHYAQRIQKAHLPSDSFIERILHRSQKKS
jgi:tetratricopeptide (TPR) repeat protein